MARPLRINPIRETDNEALGLAAELSAETLGALATLDPDSGFPSVSRVTTLVRGGTPVVMISDLSNHTRALKADPRCSIMLGSAPDKGDPLAFPRVTVFARGNAVERGSPEHAELREAWLAAHPKASLYIDFADFRFWRLEVDRASLNGGFGKAYELTAEEWSSAAR